jgi:hypothetical protein
MNWFAIEENLWRRQINESDMRRLEEHERYHQPHQEEMIRDLFDLRENVEG